MDHVNKSEVNIITYEDPVENKVHWLNQSQIRSDIGFTFASGLRAGLRQDPDIMMVWEIRDHETLEMAMESAMTWHLVFSTVHTNSAIETISRVLNLWAEPYMLSGTFNLVIAQRLCRKICEKCKSQKVVKDDEKWNYTKKSFSNFHKEKLKIEIQKRGISQEQRNIYFNEWVIHVWTWKDPKTWEVCEHCMWTWYKWRIGLYEFMNYSDDIKTMILEKKSALEIEKIALADWMITLERDWIFKIIKWITDLDQVYKFVKIK